MLLYQWVHQWIDPISQFRSLEATWFRNLFVAMGNTTFTDLNSAATYWSVFKVYFPKSITGNEICQNEGPSGMTKFSQDHLLKMVAWWFNDLDGSPLTTTVARAKCFKAKHRTDPIGSAPRWCQGPSEILLPSTTGWLMMVGAKVGYEW